MMKPANFRKNTATLPELKSQGQELAQKYFALPPPQPTLKNAR